METSLEPPSWHVLEDCATTCQWHTASFTAGATCIDWKLILVEEGTEGFPLLCFFIVTTLPVVFIERWARPKRDRLVQKGKGRREGGIYYKKNWYGVEGEGLTLQNVEGGEE